MIEFDQVSKVFPGGTKAVDNLTLSVSKGETLVLLGTSGSGKTTTMKMVNRLIEPSSGTISIEGSDIMDHNPVALRRGIGYAIQHIGLFPHMNVAENIGAVPRLLEWKTERIEQRVDELLSMVGLDPAQFRERYPSQLSGGQRQRVGVARALSADPPVVLMDEPFGALDPITREQLQTEFLELESEIQKTIIFVTHDVFEAIKMGDRVAILDAGRLQQVAAPGELVENPANEFVDAFLGQHRFQLSLLTRTIESMVEDFSCPGSEEKSDQFLRVRNSMVDALDMFKKTRMPALPVRKRGSTVGSLSKKRLLSEITKVLGELETAQ